MEIGAVVPDHIYRVTPRYTTGVSADAYPPLISSKLPICPLLFQSFSVFDSVRQAKRGFPRRGSIVYHHVRRPGQSA